MFRRFQRREDSEEDEENIGESIFSFNRQRSSSETVTSIEETEGVEIKKAGPIKHRCHSSISFNTFILLSTILIALFWTNYFYQSRFWSTSSEDESFVTIKDGGFVKDCRPYYVVGFNAQNAITAALATLAQYRLVGGKSGKTQVREMFRAASRAGLNVARVWVHPQDENFVFQSSPGNYYEEAFRALDFVINEASKHDLKLILSLVDTWKYYNGVDQFVDWSSTAPKRKWRRPADAFGDVVALSPSERQNKECEEVQQYEARRRSLFFRDDEVKRIYQKHLEAIVYRRNTFNGKLYKEDVTIMGWDLLNEPRCETWAVPHCNQYLQSWIEEMSTYLKKLDPNHLITIGSEGFFNQSSPWKDINPQPWAADLGQDFVHNHLAKNIDFASIHVWADTWNRNVDEFHYNWLEQHINIAEDVLHKPVLIEEFGRKVQDDKRSSKYVQAARDPVFQSTYDLIERKILDGSKSIGGSIYWKWKLAIFDGSKQDAYDVDKDDSTFKIITSHASFIQNHVNSIPPCHGHCWIGHSTLISRTCHNRPEICQSHSPHPTHYHHSTAESEIEHHHYHQRSWNQSLAVHKQQRALYSKVERKETKMYATSKSCCRSGEGGAFVLTCSSVNL